MVPLGAHDVILTAGVILAAGLVSIPVAERLRLPHMILMLAAGAVLGPSLLDVVDVPLESLGAELLFTLGVSFILFHGGLNLSAKVLAPVSVGLGLLVVPGVVVTAVLCGLVAAAAFDVPLTTGLLIGAVIAPTDPAILIPLFGRMHVRPKVAQTLVAESALNDPTGAVLAVAFLGLVVSGEGVSGDPLIDVAVELGISAGLGIVFGLILAITISSGRIGVLGKVAGIEVLALVALSLVFAQSAGAASGYLGPFVAGFMAGNMDRLHLGMRRVERHDMHVLVSSMSQIMVIFVFVVLGANLPFGDIADHLLPASLVVATLVLVARPLVVFTCLSIDRRGRWTLQEMIFLAWTRETGVVPAALAALVVGRGVADGTLVVVTVALAVLVTLGVQTSMKSRLARRLGLVEMPMPPAAAAEASERSGSTSGPTTR